MSGRIRWPEVLGENSVLVLFALEAIPRFAEVRVTARRIEGQCAAVVHPWCEPKKVCPSGCGSMFRSLQEARSEALACKGLLHIKPEEFVLLAAWHQPLRDVESDLSKAHEMCSSLGNDDMGVRL